MSSTDWKAWIDWSLPFLLLVIVFYFLFRKDISEARKKGRLKSTGLWIFAGVLLWIILDVAAHSPNPLVARIGHGAWAWLILGTGLYVVLRKRR